MMRRFCFASGVGYDAKTPPDLSNAQYFIEKVHQTAAARELLFGEAEIAQ